MTSSNPVCPSCKSEVEAISLSRNFIFVNGVREFAGVTWNLPCCNTHLLDDELDFIVDYQDEEVGRVPVRLNDRNNGNLALKWIDQLPEEETDSHGG